MIQSRTCEQSWCRGAPLRVKPFVNRSILSLPRCRQHSGSLNIVLAATQPTEIAGHVIVNLLQSSAKLNAKSRP